MNIRSSYPGRSSFQGRSHTGRSVTNNDWAFRRIFCWWCIVWQDPNKRRIALTSSQITVLHATDYIMRESNQWCWIDSWMRFRKSNHWVEVHWLRELASQWILGSNLILLSASSMRWGKPWLLLFIQGLLALSLFLYGSAKLCLTELQEQGQTNSFWNLLKFDVAQNQWWPHKRKHSIPGNYDRPTWWNRE